MGYGLLYAAEDIKSGLIVSLIVALLVVILLYSYILPEKRRAVLNGFFTVVHDFFSVKTLWIEAILKFMYVFGVIFLIIFGISLFFVDGLENKGWYGLFCIIIGPIIERLAYEFTMLFIWLVKNVMDIRNKLYDAPSQFPEGPKTSAAEVFGSITQKLQAATESKNPAGDSVAVKTENENVVFCSKCGYKNPGDSAFCAHCGNKMSE